MSAADFYNPTEVAPVANIGCLQSLTQEDYSCSHFLRRAVAP